MFTPFYQMQAPEFLPQRVGVGYPQPAMLVSMQTQPQVHQKEKKILRIVDPDTKEVTNEKEISASMSAPTEEHMSGDSQENVEKERKSNYEMVRLFIRIQNSFDSALRG
ncbi:unnamed protein product [Toxocara canis]|uniref:Polyadenylate-binding protein-interacting protein 3 n=1 Tax=Toxocara canis TaxID=6265 RepID=A0A183VEW2_TOXCA|nr:unnamed protein product [Toxocara canis]